jgi:hypothetical protein
MRDFWLKPIYSRIEMYVGFAFVAALPILIRMLGY